MSASFWWLMACVVSMLTAWLTEKSMKLRTALFWAFWAYICGEVFVRLMAALMRNMVAGL